MDIRDRSCLLLCSLLLKALLQNWHLYFFSGAREVFREAEAGDSAAGAGTAATLAPGIVEDGLSRGCVSGQGLRSKNWRALATATRRTTTTTTWGTLTATGWQRWLGTRENGLAAS